MESFIKLLSIIALVAICTEAIDNNIGTTIVHRDVTTVRPIREDFINSTVGIKRDIENGTRLSREEPLNVSRRSVPIVHRQFVSTTVKPSRVKSSIGETTRSQRDVSTTHNIHVRAAETTRSSRDLNVTKRDVEFNHTIQARAFETTRSERDVSTTHIIQARGLETTRPQRDLNVTKRAAHKDEKKTTTKSNKVKLSIDETTRSQRDISTTHAAFGRGVETTRSERDVSTTHIIHARAVDTTRHSRDLNATKRAAHKDEKKTTTKSNKVKLSIGETTRLQRDITTTHAAFGRAVDTTRSQRDLSTTHNIHAREVDTTRHSRDLNATKRAASVTTPKLNKKVKLSVEGTVTNFTNAKVRSVNFDKPISIPIVKHDAVGFNTTRPIIARDATTVIKRELFGGDLNVTKRAIDTTTRVKREVAPNRDQVLLYYSNNGDNNGGDDDESGDNGDE